MNRVNGLGLFCFGFLSVLPTSCGLVVYSVIRFGYVGP